MDFEPRNARSPRRARFLTAGRFLIRSLTLRGSSFLLALLAVTTGATVTATMLNLKAGLRSKMSRELRRYGPNVLVTPAGGEASAATTSIGSTGPTSLTGLTGSTGLTGPTSPTATTDMTAMTARTLDESRVRALPGALGSAGDGGGASISPMLIAFGAVMRAPESRGLEATQGDVLQGTEPRSKNAPGADTATGSVTTPSGSAPTRASTAPGSVTTPSGSGPSGGSTAPESVTTASGSGPNGGSSAPGSVTTAPRSGPTGDAAVALGGGAGVREEAAATADLLWKMATPATVVGADFGALRRVQPSWRLNGAWPEPDEGACLVGASLASRAGLGPGGEALVWTGGSERGAAVLRVAGVVVTGESEDEQVFVPLKVLQRATGLAGRVSLAALSIDGSTEAVESAALRIVAALPGSSAHPLRQIAAAQGALLGKLQRMMLLLTAVVLLLSALCLSTTLMSSVIAREGEIGLMRSIGAGDGEILKMFFGEVSLLGLFGGLLGLALGAGATRLIGQQLFETAIEPRWGVIPVVLASCVVLCLISVLLPLRTALAVAPATALRGE